MSCAPSPSGFVLLSDVIPDILLDIRYYSTYNFIGTRIDGYEQSCALMTQKAALALLEVSSEAMSKGFRLRRRPSTTFHAGPMIRKIYA